ncbi:hypothetical protein [Pontibacterium sp.]|uniref:hypothetical protein n=1 Tax=Pontibacterium sp. TaxID=2036026 RepID=UPI0035126D22
MNKSPLILAITVLASTLLWSAHLRAQDDVSQLVLPEYPPLDTFEPISQRPLFNSTRRPKPKTEDFQQDVSQSELAESWRLVGIILNNDTPLALMAQKKGEKRLTLARGMPLDQTWMISEIGQDYIVLEGNDEQARLELWEPREKQAPKRDRGKRNAQQEAQQEQSPNTNTRTQRAQGAPVRAVAPGKSGTNGG